MGVLLTHNATCYRTERLVAEAPTYRLYLASGDSGQQYLLQIAAAITDNGELDRAAFVLKELKSLSDLLEADYAKSAKKGKQLNYDRLFPQVLDSFVSLEQGRRRVNVLAFKDVDKPTQLAPLSNVRQKDGLRLDLQSSAWVMGRLLKLLNLTHNSRLTVGLLSGKNVLIDPERHFMVVLDWSAARFYPDEVPVEQREQEIAEAARTVFESIGGNVITLTYPYDADGGETYVELLRDLASCRESDAGKANRQFYQLVHGLFGRGFRPTNLLPL